jgi:hypothetical protein
MGLFSGIKKAFKKVFKGIKKVFKKVGKFVGKILNSDFGKILMIAAAVFTGGAALMAGIGNASAASGFIGKFVAGAKGFMSGLLRPMATWKGAIQGAQAGTGILAGAQAGAGATANMGWGDVLKGVADTGGATAPGDIIDPETAGNALSPSPEEIQAAFESGSNAGGQFAPEVAPDVMNRVSSVPNAGGQTGAGLGDLGGLPPGPGDAQAMANLTSQAGPGTGSQMLNATADTGGLGGVFGRMRDAMGKIPGGDAVANAGSGLGDFLKSTGGGLITSNLIGGWGQGLALEDQLKYGGYSDRQWADPRQQMILAESAENARAGFLGRARRYEQTRVGTITPHRQNIGLGYQRGERNTGYATGVA